VQITGGESAVIGIDLGGEYIKTSMVKPRVPLEIVMNSEGFRKTAAVVGFVDGEQIVSNGALNQQTKRPLNVVGYVKMLLGKGPESDALQWLRDAHYTNQWTEVPDVGTLQTELKNTGLGEGMDEFTAVELMAMLLDKTREYAVRQRCRPPPTARAHCACSR
jgi:molecular chaperone DnaK (HSP70)